MSYKADIVEGLWFAVLVLPPLFGGLCLFVGAFALVQSLHYRSYRSHKWPGAPGVVLSAEVREDVSVDGLAGSVSYWPRIAYEYTVAGVTYTGDLITFADQPRTREFAEATVARYPPGLAVTVRYQPDSPRVALLDPRPVALSFGWLWLAAICFAVWLVALAGLAAHLYLSR